MTERKAALAQTLRPVLAAAVGLALGVGVTAFAGENPLDVFFVIVNGAFGSSYDLGLTLFYTTPLILTGLAVAVPFRAGLFNIGAEGQLVMGALGATVVGVTAKDLAPSLAVPLALLAAFVFGAVWGAIPGWLKARRGGHEVISTIMMNFIAAGLTSYVALYLIPSTDSQNPESARIGAAFMIKPWEYFSGAPVGPALVLAVVLAILLQFFFKRTTKGFELKAIGANKDAAATAGIDAGWGEIFALALAGGIAGLVAAPEIMGNSGRFKLGFSPEYGFIGIPVALLARAHPIGILFSALLFGALQKGTSELDLETNFVTRDLAAIIQAMVVLAVSAEGGLTLWLKKRRKR